MREPPFSLFFRCAQEQAKDELYCFLINSNELNLKTHNLFPLLNTKNTDSY